MLIIHYGEIGLKGKNRTFFENCLVKNIRKAIGVKKIGGEYGRIVVDEEGHDREFIKKRLEMLPGIENFSFGIQVESDIEKIKEGAFEVAKAKEFNDFRVDTRRADKNFPYTSVEVNEIVGREIKEKTGKKVNLENPNLTIFIEIGRENTYIYADKFYGIGGLPVGSQGKVIAMLSGGIDSPVASFLMMKRGCRVIFVHFYNEFLGSPNKVEKIVQKLSDIQLDTRAYFVPYGNMQTEIIRRVPSKYRMLIYRRYMMRISDEIAGKEKAMAIVTGDSLGQVASQTLENIRCIYDSSNIPVFAPLIGMNKKEIIEMAKKLGTYEISIRQYQDCCRYMVAKHPVTRANLEMVERYEEKIGEELIHECLDKAEVRIYSANTF